MRLVAVIFAIVSVTCFAEAALAGAVLENKLRAHVNILASDAFEGRGPGTDGERKTTDYISESWRRAKLKPSGNAGGWLAPVPLVERSPATSKFTFYQNGHRLKFADDDIILIGREEVFTAQAVPVVFAGYGTDADADAVKGKIAFMLAGAPNDVTGTQSAERRAAMLVAAGAQGVILVADGNAGSWAATRRRFMAKNTVLQSGDRAAALLGAVSAEFAVAIVTAANQDWDGLRKAAAKPEFSPVPLGVIADFNVTTNVRRYISNNVIGKIAGQKKNSGAVVFMAHWDHLGICRPDDEIDRICNGAIDNASGIAVITEVASALAKKRFDRDIYFVATTAEETGLLGAYSFAANPPLPLDQIVAAMNVDMIAIAPAGANVAIIGRGKTNLDTVIDSVAKKLRLKVEPSEQANSFLKRQDGWALTQQNVPAVMINSSFSDLAFLEKYLGNDYHNPSDELTSATDFAGAAQDTVLHIALGKYFASVRAFAGNKTGS